MLVGIIGCTSLTKFFVNTLNKLKIYDMKFIISKKNDGINSDYEDLEKFFGKKTKVIHDKNINKKNTINFLKQSKVDLIFCIGWSHIINSKILKIPKFGVIGHHPSYLPHNRGKHPIIWAKFLGLKYFGSSFFYMTEKIDQGIIIDRKKIAILKNENAADLFFKLKKIIKKQIENLKIKKNKLKIDKKKIKYGNYWRKRNLEDGGIDFRMSAFAVHNLIQALTKPYPGAYVKIKNIKYNIYKSEIITNKKQFLIPGEIIKKSKNFLIIKCYKDSIKIFNKSLSMKYRNKKYLQ